MSSVVDDAPPRKRLAIIGGGSSGLVTLKYALDLLPTWDVRCFEQSNHITGAWGNPYPGFVSTSTKYTTQFACFPAFDANVHPDGGASRSEFFRGGEYGEYLEQFADEFSLRSHIALRCRVENLRRAEGGVGWTITLHPEDEPPTDEHFDAVVICTGLAAKPNPIECDVRTLAAPELAHLDDISGQCVVVVGGGESAVDFANRLAQPERGNRVFLSLHSGIRVSPRYHPIRGVPSDFLRNRLMLSIHEDIRNWIGQRFVEARIRYQETFERLFPRKRTKQPTGDADATVLAGRKEWAYRLTKAARANLFNMFHNKSDDFLDAVGRGDLRIIGPPVDRTFRRFREFDAGPDSESGVDIAPDLVVPAIGFRHRLDELSGGTVRLADFHLGCCHTEWEDLYLVGHARPVIGNIPSMSEMQARLVCSLLAGECPRPDDLVERHRADAEKRRRAFPGVDHDLIFPVEMIPYCDQLATLMHALPTRRRIGLLRAWWRMHLAPATTIHYRTDGTAARDEGRTAPVYMPTPLILFLLGLKPFDRLYRLFRR